MSDATVLPQPGDTIAGLFQLDRVIGVGSTSIVFGGRNRESGERIAIKWLLPDDAAEPTADESDLDGALDPSSRVVGHFRHPNILAARDIGRATGSLYVLMDWLDGESLAARLARVGAMPISEVLSLLIPCMRGMQAAHDAGIVHCDLKPANILICSCDDGSEVGKVLDFELDQRCESVGDALALLGRPKARREALEYQPPEQRTGRTVDHRADVYAFGAIVYRTLSGHSPFTHPAVDRTLTALAFEDDAGDPQERRTLPTQVEVVMLPDEGEAGAHARRSRKLPSGADAVLRRALARDPAERFQSLGELADALEECGECGRQLATSLAPPAGRPWSGQEYDVPGVATGGADRNAVHDSLRADDRVASARTPLLLTCLGLIVLCAVLALRSRESRDSSVNATFERVAHPGSPQAAVSPPRPVPQKVQVAQPTLEPMLEPAGLLEPVAIDDLPRGMSTPPNSPLTERAAPERIAAAPARNLAAPPRAESGEVVGSPLANASPAPATAPPVNVERAKAWPAPALQPSTPPPSARARRPQPRAEAPTASQPDAPAAPPSDDPLEMQLF